MGARVRLRIPQRSSAVVSAIGVHAGLQCMRNGKNELRGSTAPPAFLGSTISEASSPLQIPAPKFCIHPSHASKQLDLERLQYTEDSPAMSHIRAGRLFPTTIHPNPTPTDSGRVAEHYPQQASFVSGTPNVSRAITHSSRGLSIPFRGSR
jgi:hypothetical protein